MQKPAAAIPRFSLSAALLVSLAIVALAASALYWMGRSPVCTCGTIKLWHGGLGDAEMSQHLTDWHTFRHVLHGIVIYWLLSVVARGHLSVGARLVLATMIEGAWETFENTPFMIDRYRAQAIARDYHGASIVNAIGDMLAMLVGFLLAARLPAWVTVLLLIATEAAILWLIHDNLTLNIIMLIYPVAWIRQWQLAG